MLITERRAISLSSSSYIALNIYLIYDLPNFYFIILPTIFAIAYWLLYLLLKVPPCKILI